MQSPLIRSRLRNKAQHSVPLDPLGIDHPKKPGLALSALLLYCRIRKNAQKGVSAMTGHLNSACSAGDRAARNMHMQSLPNLPEPWDKTCPFDGGTHDASRLPLIVHLAGVTAETKRYTSATPSGGRRVPPNPTNYTHFCISPISVPSIQIFFD